MIFAIDLCIDFDRFVIDLTNDEGLMFHRFEIDFSLNEFDKQQVEEVFVYDENNSIHIDYLFHLFD